MNKGLSHVLHSQIEKRLSHGTFQSFTRLGFVSTVLLTNATMSQPLPLTLANKFIWEPAFQGNAIIELKTDASPGTAFGPGTDVGPALVLEQLSVLAQTDRALIGSVVSHAMSLASAGALHPRSCAVLFGMRLENGTRFERLE
jgi:hypothetical protein